MSRIDVVELSIQGTWIDGYLPGTEELKQLIHKYRDLDLTQEGIPMEYGFTCDNKGWSRMDYFASLASALRDEFDHKNIPDKSRTGLCFTWMAKIDKEPTDSKVLPLYEEYLADPRKDDYCHFITIHGECPVEEDCLQQLMQQLHFQSKLDNSYMNPGRFKDCVSQILTRYARTIAVPHEGVEKHLDVISSEMFFSFF